MEKIGIKKEDILDRATSQKRYQFSRVLERKQERKFNMCFWEAQEKQCSDGTLVLFYKCAYIDIGFAKLYTVLLLGYMPVCRFTQ